ncbi:MAG: DMT family transporter [Desulfomonilaceae bacterium]|nr:DMT family transporter [Desulfomonilaceae bacterium]
MPIAILFVLLWSTGFIGAKLGLPYAEPFTFLLVRFWLVTAIVLALAVITRAPWPGSSRDVLHLVVGGLLIHATYLSGVFYSMYKGVPAGVTALIVGMQPVLTAIVVGPLLGEKVIPRQWLGLALGVIGVALVVHNKLSLNTSDTDGFVWSAAALLGITAGTLYQKKYCTAMDLRTSSVIQYLAAGIAMSFAAPLFESMKVVWTGEFVFALLWLSLVLSVGAIFLLYVLIRRGKASSTASLFYLVPPCTGLIAYFVFGETLGVAAIFGMGIALVGVALVVWRP